MLTIEELLKPRCKVIADYPKCRYKIGDILYVDDKGSAWIKHEYLFYTDPVESVAKYPHLFESLPWWKDRKVEDMPEYVKVTETPDQKLMPGMVMKLTWLDSGWGRSDNGEVFPYTNCFEPATRKEYEAYLQTTNPVK